MRVIILDEAKAEHKALPARERVAIQSAIEKLIAYGLQLGFSRSSAVRGIDDTLRELHPRAGRSPWWAFYRRSGEFIVIAAIGPEASVDPSGFQRAVHSALTRLIDFEGRGFLE